jgi:hypothetical protein
MAWDRSSLAQQLKHSCDYRSCRRAFVEKGSGQWDTFWDRVLEQRSEEHRSAECCFVLEFEKPVDDKGTSALSRHIVVPSGMSRSVMLKFDHGIRAQISLEIDLSESSQFGIYFGGILSGESEAAVDIVSRQENTNSHFLLTGRTVSLASSRFAASTLGIVGAEAGQSSCVYDLQVLQIGEGGIVYGEPRMEVERGDIIAEHGFSVGRIPSDELTYLESRGMGKDEAEELYAKGFLGL